jgi:putative FmdB family regulatory protein
MPTYEYHCRGCHGDFERFVHSASAPAPACPKCGSDRTAKLLSRVAAHTSTDYTTKPEQERPPALAADGTCTRCPSLAG